MNRDEFYTAFKHDIITSKLKPGELLKEKQIMQDYTGIYYANPYELTGINDRVQDFVPRADGQLFFITSDDGETITRNTSVTD